MAADGGPQERLVRVLGFPVRQIFRGLRPKSFWVFCKEGEIRKQSDLGERRLRASVSAARTRNRGEQKKGCHLQ